MIAISAASVSDRLSIEEVIAGLKASSLVDGIAEFGSRAANQAQASSDYDLLILVQSMPAPVFQMVTTIDGRLADVVLVEVEMAERLLNALDRPKPGSREAMFAQKMQTARILYDASDRLHRVRQQVTSETWDVLPANDHRDSEMYMAWFWQSLGLLHLDLLAQSQDPLHQSAFDMVLASCLSGTWRCYFDVRRMAWEGEKAAIRYWTLHDSEYLGAIRRCLDRHDRQEKLAAYREAVERTIEPIGKTLNRGETALVLAGPNSRVEVQRTLHFWQSLFTL